MSKIFNMTAAIVALSRGLAAMGFAPALAINRIDCARLRGSGACARILLRSTRVGRAVGTGHLGRVLRHAFERVLK